MSQERTQAVVLRGVDFGESSRIVTLLTPERGRVVCMAKGARRKKSTVAPVLDTLNRVEIVYFWKDGRAVQPLGEATLLDGFDGIKRDLTKMSFVTFPIEVVCAVAHENEPSEALYAVLVRGLEDLVRWPGDARAHACWHVLQLLSAAGFEPSLDQCAGCGAPVETASGFSYAGGVTCPSCPRDRWISADQITVLRSLCANRTACPDLADVGEAYALLRDYAARQLETRLRSVRVLDQMFD